ncbi:hypothetical protein P5673_002535, partial [Acropora cervicornis]
DISFLIVTEKSLTPEEQKQENFGRKSFPETPDNVQYFQQQHQRAGTHQGNIKNGISLFLIPIFHKCSREADYHWNIRRYGQQSIPPKYEAIQAKPKQKRGSYPRLDDSAHNCVVDFNRIF